MKSSLDNIEEWTIRETGNIWEHKTQDEDNQNIQRTQHNMRWTPLCAGKHKYRLTSIAFTLSILLTKDTCLKEFTFEIRTITQPYCFLFFDILVIKGTEYLNTLIFVVL